MFAFPGSGQQRTTEKCAVKHKGNYLYCTNGVVNKISLACGFKYSGQAGGYVNARLFEDTRDVMNYASQLSFSII